MELILIPYDVELNNEVELILVPNDSGFSLIFKNVDKYVG